MQCSQRYYGFTRHALAVLIMGVFFLFGSALPGQAQIITTIAGTGTSGYNGDGINATAAQLNGPHGFALDTDGNIYIAEYGGHRIRKITISTGLISTIAGTGAAGYNGDGILATAAQINASNGMAFDANGNLYIADRNNHRIRKISKATGIISTIAGTGTGGYNGDGIAATAAQLNQPIEIAFDASGNILFSDWANNRVRKINKSTGLISTIAGTGTGGYNGDGIAATAAQLNLPIGIIFDNAGNIYIGDWWGHRVRKITISTGLISTFAGTGTMGYNGDGIAATAAQLDRPGWIQFDDAGNMYIGEAGNHRVRKITAATGIISTIAGTGTGGYNGDGIAATAALLYWPISIYFDKNNCKMYIGETFGNRVRKITGGFSPCLPAVANGNKISCQVLPAVTINNTNYNSWVPIYDSAGRIAAEINANGNTLGVVNTSLFTKHGACRVDSSHRIYMNRNINITPQNQPSSNVSVRLYLLKSELDSLKTALNDLQQPSGVASINDVNVFKNNDPCSIVGHITAFPLSTTSSSYNNDYYLEVSIGSFSSFYFANKLLPAILPVKISSFTGYTNGSVNVLNWKAICNSSVSFVIERSENGIHFMDIGNLPATAADCNLPFVFKDNAPGNDKNYYRLKVIEPVMVNTYSNVILLNGKKGSTLQLTITPNVINEDIINVRIFSKNTQQAGFMITDMQGRVLLQKNINVQAGTSVSTIATGRLASGAYLFYAIGIEGRSNVVQFIKY